MATGAIVAIIVVVVLILLVIGGVVAMRRRRLQQQFGPEYDRLAEKHDSKLKAESELAERQRRVRKLDIRPLDGEARARYATRWAGLQERFVDAPAESVAESQALVQTVMHERGYPTEEGDQVAADLSVEHAKTIGNFRAAEEISASSAAGTASTEDLRQAMIHYRALFRDLLGDTPATDGSADVPPEQAAATTADGRATTGDPAYNDDPAYAEGRTGEPVTPVEDENVTTRTRAEDLDGQDTQNGRTARRS
jgi:hypothetical protein